MKKILMAAAAVTALTAGSAGAASITAAKVSAKNLGIAVTGASPVAATSFTLANTAIIAASGQGLANAKTTASAGDNTVAAQLSAAANQFYPNASGTNYSVTYTLSGTGAPKFQGSIANIKLTGQSGTCATAIGASGVATATPVGGGAAGTTYVTAVFNIPSATCGGGLAPTGVSIDAPFTLSAVGTAIGTFSFKVVSTDAEYDAPAAQPLVITAAPYTVAVGTAFTAAATATATAAKPTRLALGGTNGVYTSLSTASGTDTLIGTVTYKTAAAPDLATAGITGAVLTPSVFADMAGTALPDITADVQLNATTSNFNIIKPSLSADGGGTPSAFTVASATPAVVTKLASTARKADISVEIASANATTITGPQSYTATITPYLSSSSSVTVPAPVTGALETIGLEGVSFVAPWVGGSLSGSQSYIRVSNSGAATGAVTVSLLSPVGANAATSVCTSSTLPKLSGVAANGELVLSPADLATCFGAFTRGDVSVVIQATSTSLTAKARNVTASTVSELSLGAGTFN